MTEEETKTAQEDFGDRVSRKLWVTFWFGALILNLFLIASLYIGLPGAAKTSNGAEAAYFLIPMSLCFAFPFIGVCLIASERKIDQLLPWISIPLLIWGVPIISPQSDVFYMMSESTRYLFQYFEAGIALILALVYVFHGIRSVFK